MRKITMAVAFVFAFLTQGYAQFPQGFEGATFPPAGWASFNGANGFGTAQEWQQSDALPATGDYSAFLSYDNTDDGETKEDWLVTPQFTVDGDFSALQFMQSQAYAPEWGSVYTIRVSTTSQTNIASFTTVDTFGESAMLPAGAYSSRLVDLSAYTGQSIYVAFVMANDDGDSWFIDDVDMVSLVSLPNCATAPITPVDGATNVPAGDVDFSWTAPATGDAPTSYDMYYGFAPDDVNIFFDTFTDTSVTIPVEGFDTTFYWRVVAKNAAGAATGCAVWSFTTQSPPGYCFSGELYPEDPYTPDTCDGVTINEIVTDAYAGEYSIVNVTSGQPYTFSSSVATDLITISNEDGDTALAYGTTPVTWTSNITGAVRFYTHTDVECGTEAVDRIRGVVCGTPSADAPDYVGLQWPPTMEFAQGATGTVYGRVYEPGVTPGDGAGAGITAWVGVNAANTNPATWNESSWVPATYNGELGNDDEYKGDIGTGLTPGTYYYAVRFRLNAGGYVYGGTDGTNGNFWNGTTHNSGVLTVNGPEAPANDECAGAIELIPAVNYESAASVTTNFGATDDGSGTSCQVDAVEDVWYSVVVPDSGSITIETGNVDGSDFNDSVVVVYSGTCGSLTEIECDDDDSDNGLFSLVELFGRTPGETLYISVSRYNGAFATGDWGDFMIAAYDASLANPTFNTGNFKAYPNPVKNVLNLSSVQNITNVAVYNLLGQQVIARTMNASEGQIDMSTLSQGTYMVKVTANNEVKTIKVIKE